MPPAPTLNRLLIVLPSWLGDVVMATPTLRLIRANLPGSLIAGLARPSVADVLAGTGLLDEVHAVPQHGLMAPKRAAAAVRPGRYQTALLLTNSFSTALTARMAGIPRRVGYARDARSMLLTDALEPARRPDGRYAVLPAVEYYWNLAQKRLRPDAQPLDPNNPSCLAATPPAYLELAVSEQEAARAREILRAAGVEGPYAVLNPGASKEAKRWPAENFARLAGELRRVGLSVLISGSPPEAELCARVAGWGGEGVVALPPLGLTLGSLKGILAGAALLVTNDTGPRHIAAALGVKTVTLFGPTDHRWTTVPTRPGGEQAIITADPALPEEEIADDHPKRCAIEKIGVDEVAAAALRLLQGVMEAMGATRGSTKSSRP